MDVSKTDYCCLFKNLFICKSSDDKIYCKLRPVNDFQHHPGRSPSRSILFSDLQIFIPTYHQRNMKNINKGGRIIERDSNMLRKPDAVLCNKILTGCLQNEKYASVCIRMDQSSIL